MIRTKIIGLSSGILLTAGLTAGLTAPSNAAPVSNGSIHTTVVSTRAVVAGKVIGYHMKQHKKRALDVGGHHPVTAHVTIYWKVQWNTAHPYDVWARPGKVKFLFKRKPESCNVTDAFEAVNFKLYIVNNYTGENWDLGNVRIKCKTSGVGEAWKTLKGAPKFPYVGGSVPKWKVNLHEELSWGFDDKYGTITGALKKHN